MADPGSTPASVENGTVRTVDGVRRVFYDGYWIRYYDPPEETPDARKNLIEQLTKRVFHHTEPGINTPGRRLDEARAAWEAETEPRRKRVKAAMLAGALLNRASDIFTVVADLERKGVRVGPDSELILECESCFLEALDHAKCVRHYSGEEGLDELWGEPFKAFSMPLAAYYESRYLKIAQTMRDLDRVAETMIAMCRPFPALAPLTGLVSAYCDAAKRVAETMKADPLFFDVWPEFVATAEELRAFDHAEAAGREAEVLALVRQGSYVMQYVAFARVPMPKTTGDFLARCHAALPADHAA